MLLANLDYKLESEHIRMNIITTCIGELPEKLREAALYEQRERRKNVVTSIIHSCLMSA